jgi:hypothetical protein
MIGDAPSNTHPFLSFHIHQAAKLLFLENSRIDEALVSMLMNDDYVLHISLLFLGNSRINQALGQHADD